MEVMPALLLLVYFYIRDIVIPAIREARAGGGRADKGGHARRAGDARHAAWLLRSVGKGAVWLAAQAGRGAWLGLVFVYFLADEALRGPAEAEGEPGGGDGQDGEEQAPGRDPYAEALARFGLAPGFRQADLSRAYKQAMRKAHPDAGGATGQAQAVNAARDLIARRHGWK